MGQLPGAETIWAELETTIPAATLHDLRLAQRVAATAADGSPASILYRLSGADAGLGAAPGPARLEVALGEFAAAYGGDEAPAREAAERISTRLSEVEAAAIGSFVLAHLAQRAAYEVHWPAEGPPTPEALSQALIAQARLADAAATLSRELDCHAGLTGSIPKLFTYDLACEASLHTEDTVLLVDAGGDDLYLNNAGGTTFLDPRKETTPAAQAYTTAAAVDLAGDDRYLGAASGNGAFNGGGDVGIGFLYDGGGDDIYNSSSGHFAILNGAGYQGLGTLVDTAGSDTYDGLAGFEGVVNGGGKQGVGVLIDLGGDDRYNATVRDDGGANGGSDEGIGWLIDVAGNDRYDATFVGSGGINGGSENGAGHLLDLAGDDRYDGRIGANGGINGAGADGNGLLLDLAGDDTYDGFVADAGGVNAGAFNLGSGVLIDHGGDDVYDGHVGWRGGVNGGVAGGIGLLRDVRGDDRYQGTVLAAGGVNGASAVGMGVLVDGAGSNLFAATTPGPAASNGATVGFAYPSAAPQTNAGVPGVLGLLIGGTGDDRYWSNGTGQGAGTQYGRGLLYDPGGSNTYRAGPGANATGLAQGAGAFGGSGILIDQGESLFALANGTTGQGVGLQGTGLVLHLNPAGSADFVSAEEATAGLLDGAGFGLRLTLGITRFLGPQTPLTCQHSPELIGASLALESQLLTLPADRVEAHICAPATDRQKPIHDPVTTEPLDPVWKPGVTCGSVVIMGMTCHDLFPDLAAFLEDDQVTMTSGGGTRIDLLSAELQTSGAVASSLSMKHVVQTVDRMCRHTCFDSVVFHQLAAS